MQTGLPTTAELIQNHGVISYAKRCKNLLEEGRVCGLPLWNLGDFFACSWCDLERTVRWK